MMSHSKAFYHQTTGMILTLPTQPPSPYSMSWPAWSLGNQPSNAAASVANCAPVTCAHKD